MRQYIILSAIDKVVLGHVGDKKSCVNLIKLYSFKKLHFTLLSAGQLSTWSKEESGDAYMCQWPGLSLVW